MVWFSLDVNSSAVISRLMVDEITTDNTGGQQLLILYYIIYQPCDISNYVTVFCSLRSVPNSFCRDKTKQVIPGDLALVAISSAESQVVHCVNSQHILQQDKNVDLKCMPGASIFNTTVCT